MKFFMTTFIFLAMFLFQSCGFFRVETYLIPADMKPRWINIEYDNPKCPPLNGSKLSQEFVIPESGFICTSSPAYNGWFQRKFFLVDAKGKRTQLKEEGNIWQEGVISKDEPSLDEGQPRCKVSLTQFFYGTKDDPMGNNPIFQDEDFLRDYHPECRNTGIQSQKKTS
jgi:hypothetical protein